MILFKYSALGSVVPTDSPVCFRSAIARAYADEYNVERIADILSSKGHARAAMELRELARLDRIAAAKPVRKESLLERVLGTAIK
jgi:hypothetical protein